MLDPAWLPPKGDDDALHLACAQATALDPSGATFRERMLEAVFALAHYPQRLALARMEDELAPNPRALTRLGSWLDAHPLPDHEPSSAALEVGCGPGRFLFELAHRVPGGVVGFDLRVGLLRIARRMLDDGEVRLPWRVEGRRFIPLHLHAPSPPRAPVRLVQGNLTRAPFAPASFPLVAALSLLDILPDPYAGFEQLDALVARGGLLLLTTPFHWEATSTPPDTWWSTPEHTGAEHLAAILARHRYEILETSDDLPWVVPSHARLVHRYALHAVLARKGA